MALGKNVEHLRTLRAMSRGAVARAIGLEDDQPIYALEKRDSKRSNLAPALAKLFQVSLEALLEDDLSQLSESQLLALQEGVDRKIPEDHEIQQIASLFESLSSDGRAELKQFAEFLLAREGKKK